MLIRRFHRAATWATPLLRDTTVGQIMELGVNKLQIGNSCYCTMLQNQMSKRFGDKDMTDKDVNNSKPLYQTSERNIGDIRKHQIGENVSRKDKIDFLVNTLMDLRDSKEAVYGALDAWVAWEQDFPIASLKHALAVLEKENQWHRVVQVIKWMLSKGQGTTMNVYGQLIRALDMDHRAEEAHKFWVMKIGSDLHSVPWQLCRSMISIYYRNKMLEDLVKLFKNLEAFGRKPPEKSIVQRVADACEMLGLVEEKERVLVKYNYLFTDEKKGSIKKYKGKRKSTKGNQDNSDLMKKAQ
ncbi:Pentatricopeptide repeat-containing protein, chloroplastic [Cucurbita argyrosperma subsp. argyrosperma]|uniref:Pentatricopeptide repeat-containing protein At4g18975, chloroplastic isoform X1 n=1 Tax=Cucurbita moschata TaxID=3662 RepID=A0A6J1HGC4_CUCMO|nr:pentatricopeptide repeat-containing protein At4g18975, chloroplastic isoform X1 [Cucurbita moschata]KAG7011428.1 Pentatricopeptide repeat-containing protein, chloroplastic [Cucurbita argyrosperma subsp. argyrosperma]